VVRGKEEGAGAGERHAPHRSRANSIAGLSLHHGARVAESGRSHRSCANSIAAAGYRIRIANSRTSPSPRRPAAATNPHSAGPCARAKATGSALASAIFSRARSRFSASFGS